MTYLTRAVSKPGTRVNNVERVFAVDLQGRLNMSHTRGTLGG